MERIETFLETFLRKLAPNESQVGQTANGRLSNGQVSNGQVSNGHASNGHVSNGQASNGSKVAPEVYRRPQAYSPVPPARHKQHQS